MMSYLNNGYDVMSYFAKFKKFLPHTIIIPSFMTVGSEMPELGRGAIWHPPNKIVGQNTPYKLGLIHRQKLILDINSEYSDPKALSND